MNCSVDVSSDVLSYQRVTLRTAAQLFGLIALHFVLAESFWSNDKAVL